MKRTFLNRKIPTYYGLLVLFLVLGITIYLLQTNRLINIRAVPAKTPLQVRITNISDTSFNVSFNTAEAAVSKLMYGDTTLNKVATDIRDGSSPLDRKIHYFEIKGLKPSTNYSFTITSGGNLFDNNGSPFSLTTGAKITNKQDAKIISGKVILPNGSIANEAIVFLQTSASQVLSVITKQDGSYSFNLNTLRNRQGTQQLSLKDTDVLSLTYYGDNQQASATVLVKNAQRIPVVTLSQSYSFTANDAASQINQASGSGQLIPKFSENNSDISNLAILIPEKNQTFNDPRPEFSGVAPAGSKINITIQAVKKITGSTQSDIKGQWTFRPEKNLEPGVYTLTVMSENDSENIQTIVESFAITSTGSSFTDPSVAPTKPPTPTITPTVSPTLIPTALPTVIASASATPSPTAIDPSPTLRMPTSTLFPTVTKPTQIPSPQPSIVSPGSNALFVSVGMITFATIISALLFFLIRV